MKYFSRMLTLVLASATSVSVFLPVIGDDLGIPENRLQWLVSAFSLSSVRSSYFCTHPISFRLQQGCFLLLLGRLADLHGRKLLYVIGTLFLGALSLGCGFAQNATSLYILRGFQGLGPAAFIPACVRPMLRERGPFVQALG